MNDLNDIARRVRRDCVRHLRKNLSPDARAELIATIDQAIGKTIGAVGTRVPTTEPEPEVELTEPEVEVTE